MSRQRTADTKPEKMLRSVLHRRGVRYRLHPRDLPGRPDIVLVRAKLVIFVDGCFWHACPVHYVPPKSNAEWWAAKLASNVDRDRRADARLVELGWEPLHVWEHEDTDIAADAIVIRWHLSDQHGSEQGTGLATAALLAERHTSASGQDTQFATG
jgi:DNA mismatch endonuclease (patch repair protein)